ncbi:16S rRNA (guanine(527)-N(7))-methyltransferase RsmG [Sphingomonas naphthae]|uniref:Ribosomal RNA small subunit methyltransferase G n=1 Tax=Sphingomonas naphthae TaxID=1813468 RepID=A0ABY7TLZ8_9SPHN|nr:16S rRNA (guanine(527)-N(7))-methyltransferase RsmG [Sphingomonas naphthae]WCT73274.1 16S rRNA (guanine(527)-N(7))-methyltransferase RsmG [Sphingomonas naphthae]
MIDLDSAAQEKIAAYTGLVTAESERQNLVSRSTLEDFANRHVADSLQLLPLATPGLWVDVGSGAGLPGILLAIAEPTRPVVMVEPRARRVEFLRFAISQLGLTNATVVAGKVEQLRDIRAAVISARAVATLDKLFEWCGAIAEPSTVWLLPKGRTAASELESVKATWQGDFRLVRSVTDAEAAIVVARNVRRRSKAR